MLTILSKAKNQFRAEKNQFKCIYFMKLPFILITFTYFIYEQFLLQKKNTWNSEKILIKDNKELNEFIIRSMPGPVKEWRWILSIKGRCNIKLFEFTGVISFHHLQMIRLNSITSILLSNKFITKFFCN